MKNEEILEKTLNKRLFDHLHTGSMKLTDKEILSAMDAARKDEAIAFAEWTVKEDYKPGAGNEHWFKWNGIECEKIPYTTEQLYQLFKSQDNK